MSQFRFLKAIVLDWAGTVVDFGSCAPAMVFQEIFRRRDVPISILEAREPMGRAKRDHIAAITEMPRVAELWRSVYGGVCQESDIDAMYADFLPLQKSTLADHSQLIDGAAEAIATMRERGLKIGSSTGYTRELMEIVSPLAAQQGYEPDCVLCAEDALRGRPAPYLLFRAAELLDVYPMYSVVKVDDTPVGIEAARNAGCWAIGVSRTGNCTGMPQAELSALPEEEAARRVQSAADTLTNAGAHLVVESVDDLIPMLDRLESMMESGAKPTT